MNKEEIFSKMKDILSDTFEIDKSAIKPETRLFEDLDLDSIDAVDLIVKLQQMTGIKIDPEAFKQVRTVEDVVAAIHTVVNNNGL